MDDWQNANQNGRITLATYPQKRTIHDNGVSGFPVEDGMPGFTTNSGERIVL